jgi:hypothetical protein
MKPQVIVTEGGEKLVILTERDYDALLARAGDEDAEDRMTVRIAAQAHEEGELEPGKLVASAPDGRPQR